jgi:hypothetical protein
LSMQQFVAAKKINLKPQHLPCLIWPLVIYYSFREQNRSYNGNVSELPWYLYTFADRPTRDAKILVPAVLPAVAETLDPLNVSGSGLFGGENNDQTEMINVYFVTYSVRELLFTHM